MSTYTAKLSWQRDGQDFLGNRYSRRHLLQFDGGAELPASSSPQIVAEPMSDASAVDPEELFVASLSSCHMLWFLSIAARRRFCVESYVDAAEGQLAKGAGHKLLMTQVTLRPRAEFSGSNLPTREQVDAMHHEAHEQCFIANSVKTEVRCEPVHAD